MLRYSSNTSGTCIRQMSTCRYFLQIFEECCGLGYYPEVFPLSVLLATKYLFVTSKQFSVKILKDCIQIILSVKYFKNIEYSKLMIEILAELKGQILSLDVNNNNYLKITEYIAEKSLYKEIFQQGLAKLSLLNFPVIAQHEEIDVKGSQNKSYISQGKHGKIYCITLTNSCGELIKIARKYQKISTFAIREISALFSFKHENVISVYQFSFIKDTCIIDMEYASHTLRTEIYGTPLIEKESANYWYDTVILGQFHESLIPSNKRRQYTINLLNGLSYIHSVNCLHLDIKASNLLICDGILKISDFGVCELFVTNGDKSHRKLFPLAYRDLELFYSSNYHEKYDNFAAACIIAEIYLGLKLFRSPEYIDDEDYHISIRSSVSRNGLLCIHDEIIRDIVISMLGFSTNERYTAKQALELLN